MKEVLSSPPVLSPPVVGLPLSLYLTVTDTATGAILAQTVEKEERAIYYISKNFLYYEVKYTPLEKTCFALVWATKKLGHYMLSYSVSVYSKMDLIKYLFKKPLLNGRMLRWTLMLSKLDLKYVPLKVIKGRAVADFLADNPIEETEVIDSWSFLDENVIHVENDIWDLYFEGASNYMGYGVGILIISSTGEHVLVSIKLDFNVTNNAGEYEACGIKSQIFSPYQTRIEELEKYFEDIPDVHLPREENQFADALSKIAALIKIPDYIDNMPICVERRSSPTYVNAIDDAEEVPHEFIIDHGTHFQDETMIILEKYKMKYHKSSPYQQQTNGPIEAANKTITTNLKKMSNNYKEWPEKIPFALWWYRTSISTATVELEIPSLRILLESQVPEAGWVQARYDLLVMLDDRRLNTLYHVQLYQKRIERAFNKKVKPRGITEGDLVPKSVRAMLPIDPRE
ncbi:uncharacterized protein LOC141601379 [Silene latifolia]|uniref:uncharacterized protein LOC141601379 n=1 Tax=Silene latifolia TaxID=37657 RepID=UPI003D7859FA